MKLLGRTEKNLRLKVGKKSIAAFLQDGIATYFLWVSERTILDLYQLLVQYGYLATNLECYEIQLP